MARIAKSIIELTGHTPLLELSRYAEKYALHAKILAKLEAFNPAGSIKDRVAKEMVLDAERKGLLKTGATIIEPTSGNTGIGLAMVARALGYRLVLTMPETMSEERKQLLKAYGAEIVLTDGRKGMTGAVKKANELLAADKNAVILGQFSNPINPETHFATTGPEIWDDTDGAVDILVSGIGTGGTVTGTGRFLKSKKPSVEVVGVEPYSSAVLSGEAAGAHGLQGIGAGFVPDTLDVAVLDRIIKVKDGDAYSAARELVALEGVLCGISAGAALWAAVVEASRVENAGKTIVVILPDSGEKYLSTGLFS